ncbi:MAG: hypothetical protein N2651_01230 [Fimbriimonadales bacterium]|nr:hypothetical protein [Fimbriimonadales bacterium]
MRHLGWIIGVCLWSQLGAQGTIYTTRALEQPVSIRHEQITLRALIQEISEQVKVPLAVGDEIANWKVTIRVGHRPAWQTLEKVAAIYNLVWRSDEAGHLLLQADSYVLRQLQQSTTLQPALDALSQQLARHHQRAAKTPFERAVALSRALLREYAPSPNAPRSEPLQERLMQFDLMDYLLQEAHARLDQRQLERLAQGEPLLFSAKPLPNAMTLGESTLEYVRIAFREGILGVSEAHPGFEPTNWLYVINLCDSPVGLLVVTDGERVLTHAAVRSRSSVGIGVAKQISPEPRNPCLESGDASRALQAQGYLDFVESFGREPVATRSMFHNRRLRETVVPSEANAFLYDPTVRVSQYLFWLAEQTNSDLIADAYALSVRGISRTSDYHGTPYQSIRLTPPIQVSISFPLLQEYRPASFDAELARFMAGSRLRGKYEDDFLMFRHEACWRLLATELSTAQRDALQAARTLDEFAAFVEMLTPAQRHRWETLGYAPFSDAWNAPKGGLAGLRFWASLSDEQRTRARRGETLPYTELTPFQQARYEEVADDLVKQQLRWLWDTRHPGWLAKSARGLWQLLTTPQRNTLACRYKERHDAHPASATLEFTLNDATFGVYHYSWRPQESKR